MQRLTCKELIEFLDTYVDGSLAPAQRIRFDGHLAKCPDCVNYLATYRGTIDLARGAWKADDDAPPVDVPEELLRAVLGARRGDQCIDELKRG